jgi:hypothetical protein
MLFDDRPAKPAKGTARDTSWDPPAEAGPAMSADEFGAEILGEGPGKQPAPAQKRPAVPGRLPAGRAPSPGSGAGSATPPALSHSLAQAAAKTAAPAPPPPAARPRSTPPAAVPIAAPPRGAIVVVAPAVVLVSGEGLAAWLWFVQQNPVLAGIAGALALTLSGVTWMALRR